MPGSGSDPSDPQPKLAMTVAALSRSPCSCSCCTCGAGEEEGPFGRDHHDHLSEAAIKQRAPFLVRLLAEAKALHATAQQAFLVGATSAAEIRDMQRLQLWLGRLIVETARSKSPRGPKK